MFPKENRFPTRIKGDFFVKAKKHFSPLFILYIRENNLDRCRATVIVPKKNVAKSSKRSEIKRYLRNLIAPQLMKKSGLDIAIYLRRAACLKNKKEIDSEIASLFLTI